jgi:hypothetical protein
MTTALVRRDGLAAGAAVPALYAPASEAAKRSQDQSCGDKKLIS